MSYVGKSVPRIDALEKVTGRAVFPGDINKPNQAYLKTLFADRPHAVIDRIITNDADQLDGVLAVLTAKDVPNNEYGLIMPDQPVLCGPGSVKQFADRVRFIGDQVAVVVAESTEIAEEALRLIKVAYRDLPVISDIDRAMQVDAPLIHPDRDSNVFCNYRIRKGNISDAFKKADVIIESEYRTPAQEHAYLQPEAGVAYIEDGVVTVEVAGQWAHEERRQIAHALSLPENMVRVIHPAIGGAFGGREDISIQIVLALAALKLSQMGINRPVKTIWSRQESIIGHHKRHPYLIRTKWAGSKSGIVLGAKVEVYSDGGAYAYTSTKVLANATLMCTGPYDIENVEVDSYAVYTNNIPGGAFRGFGGPQGAFAAECQINKLAEALEIDPVEIRKRNTLREGSLLSVGTPLPKGVSMPAVIDKCALESNWIERRRDDHEPGHPIRRGMGFAGGYKNVGFSFGFPEECWAKIELFGGSDISKVVVKHAAAEVGQGAHTVILQMAADALTVPMDIIQFVGADTSITRNSGSVSASRMTFMAGNAVKGAAKIALEKWADEERPAIATYQYRPPVTTPYHPESGKSEPNFAYGYVAQVVEIEVDTQTGYIKIVKVVSVNDVGKAVNPDQVIGQIEGGVVQASGYTILENFIQADGIVRTPNFSTYLIPGVLDIPENVESVLLEYPDPIGPYGARGMAEMPFIPVAPAIAAAIHDALGIWIDEFPLTPQRVLEAMGKI